MARTVRQINGAINQLMPQSLPRELADKQQQVSVNLNNAFDNYLKANKGGLVTKKDRRRATITGMKSSFLPKRTYNTKEILAFINSVFFDDYIKQYLYKIYFQGKPYENNLFINKLFSEHKGEIKLNLCQELIRLHDLKQLLQDFYNKDFKHKHSLITRIISKKTSSVYPEGYKEKKHEDYKQGLIDSIVSLELKQFSLSLDIQGLFERYYDDSDYIKLIHTPSLKARRQELNEVDKKFQSKFEELVQLVDRDLLHKQALLYFRGNSLKVKNDYISYNIIKDFEDGCAKKEREQEVFNELKYLFKDRLNSEFVKYKPGFVLHTSDLLDHISNQTLRTLFSDDEEASLAEIVTPSTHILDDTLVSTSVKKSKKLIPKSSKLIDAIPAGIIFSAGALYKDFLDVISANGHSAIGASREVSDAIDRYAEFKANNMERVNSAWDYIDHGETAELVNGGLITGLGLIAVGAKFVNSTLALANSIEHRVRLSIKRKLILDTISTLFDTKIWQNIEITHHTSKRLGILSLEKECHLFDLVCSSIEKYDAKQGFVDLIKKLISNLKANQEIWLAKAFASKLSFLELNLLYGYLLDKPAFEISGYEIERLENIVESKSNELDSILGLESLPDYNSYKQILRANKLSLVSIANALANLARLEDVAESANKDLILAVTKTALSSCSLAAASAVAAGSGGFVVSMIPATMEGADKLVNLAFYKFNKDTLKLQEVAQSIHAGEVFDEMDSKAQNLTTLYDIHKLQFSDFPGRIIESREQLKQQIVSFNRARLKSHKLICFNSHEIESLKKQIKKLLLQLKFEKSISVKQCIKLEIADCKAQIRHLYANNSKFVYQNLDYERLALDYYDQAVFKLLVQPVIYELNHKLSLLKPTGLILFDSDKIKFKQMITKMHIYLGHISVVNMAEVSHGLQLIANNYGFSKSIKPLLDNTVSQLLCTNLITNSHDCILYYRAMCCESEEQRELLLQRCDLDYIRGLEKSRLEQSESVTPKQGISLPRTVVGM